MDIFGPAWEDYLPKIFADWKDKVSEDDLVLIAGDISWAMTLQNSIPDLELISKNPGKIIITRGNHDFWWKSISSLRSILPDNMYALQNDAIKFDNYIICGTRGWTVPENTHQSQEDEKIYKREVLRLEMSLKSAKKLQENNEKIICMIHFPPFNSKKQENEFTRLIKEYNVDAVVYGHLHGTTSRSDRLTYINEIPYYLTSCDQVGNNLVEIF